jgi:hypothetical protein
MLLSETRPDSGWRAGLVLGPALVISLLALIGFRPLPQDLAYHAFADQRTLYGVPHFGNVVSNLPFAVIGALGCWWIVRHGRSSSAFEEPHERVAYLVFFAGEFLTCFGSGYYHGGPSNATLVWDRLVFSLMLTSMFAIVVTEFVDRRVGPVMLAPMVLFGVVSVLYCLYTEMHGRGDLRFYAVIQFYPTVRDAHHLFAVSVALHACATLCADVGALRDRQGRRGIRPRDLCMGRNRQRPYPQALSRRVRLVCPAVRVAAANAAARW